MTSSSKRIPVFLVISATLVLLGGCVRYKPERSLPSVEQVFGQPGAEAPARAQALEPTATPIPALPAVAPTVTPVPALPSATPSPAVVEAPPTVTPPPPPASPTAQPTAEPTIQSTPAATVAPTPAPTLAPALPVGLAAIVVGEGDTLYALAERHGTTIAALQQVNSLGDTDHIEFGQTLLLPAGAIPDSGPEIKTTNYWIGQGETLSDIARRYKTTVAEIVAANPAISDEDQIYAGMRIVVPVDTARPSRTYQVKYGESLSGIAARYKVSIRSIVQANNLRNANQIYAGQWLVIPD